MQRNNSKRNTYQKQQQFNYAALYKLTNILFKTP
jgi:hypothetical protein